MAKHNKFRTTPEQLRNLYETRKLSVQDIANQCRCTTDTIHFYLQKYEITDNRRGRQPLWNGVDREELRRMYHDEGKTMPEIALAIGCKETTVWRKINEYSLRLSEDEKNKRSSERRRDYVHGRLSAGYNFLKKDGHPLANSNGYVSEHRLNAEGAMGRPVTKEERIHHINLRKRDNRVENLAVLPSQSVHRKVHDYLQSIGAYMVGLTDVRPGAFDFGSPVFWGGKYVTSIDLIAGIEPATGPLNGEARASGQKEFVN